MENFHLTNCSLVKDNKNENITYFDSVVNPVGSLLAYCDSRSDSLANPLVAIAPFSPCWNLNGRHSVSSEEHPFSAGKIIGLQGNHIASEPVVGVYVLKRSENNSEGITEWFKTQGCFKINSSYQAYEVCCFHATHPYRSAEEI